MQKTAHAHCSAWLRQRWVNQTLLAMTPSEARGHRTNRKTIVLVMKLTTIFLIAGLMQVHAKGTAQAVTISGKDMPIQKVFAAIKKQTKFNVAGDKSLLQDARRVSVDVVNMDLNDFLILVLKDQPFGYKLADKTIILSEKNDVDRGPTPDIPSLTAPPVTGIVRGPDGQPLAGVNIIVKGTKRGTTTSADGTFNIEAKEREVLVISSIGYAERVITIGNDNVVGVVQLSPSQSKLDEVQIIAYGETTKRFNTGNMGSVKAKEIAKQPVTNPLLALQGRIPGVFITQSSGLPGSGVIIRIQGQNSLFSGNDPLYVIDGVPYMSQLMPTLTSNQGSSGNTSPTNAGSGNPLSFINPADIESIDILKDADATSIYGSRAANGAILITTKKGKPSPTKTDFKVQSGWGNITRKIDLLNTQQYLRMRHQAKLNDGETVGPDDYDLNGTWDTTRSSDWQDLLIGNTATYTDAQGSVSGGSFHTQFLIGVGYRRETTVFPGDFHDKNGSLHFNLNHTGNNQRFKLQLTAEYLANTNNLMSGDLSKMAVSTPPVAPALYNPDGSLNWAPLPNGISTWNNPLSALNNKAYKNTKNLIGGLTLSYELLHGLEIKSSFGYTNMIRSETTTYSLLALAPEQRPFSERMAFYADGTVGSWNIEPQITYRRHVGRGRLEAYLGSSLYETNSHQNIFFGVGYNNDHVMADVRSATSVHATGSLMSTYTYNAVWGRLNYNLDDKYIVNLTARRDGSSRFGPENLFQNFGSAAAAWIFSSEKFIQNNLHFLSFGKLKLSYGTTGNDQIGEYQFMSLYNPVAYQVPYQNSPALNIDRLSNPYLQWEETRKFSSAIDLGFFNDRILLTALYYQNRSSNQLLFAALPDFVGFGSIVQNLPATVQNHGFEFSFTTTNIKRSHFGWTSNFNLTLPRNKLLRFDNMEESTYLNYVVGKPINFRRLFHYLGVNPETGSYEFQDKNGEPTATPVPFYLPNSDATVFVSTDPVLYGGFQNTITYKGLELDFLFQFTKQKGNNQAAFGYHPGFFRSEPDANYGNQPAWITDAWQKPGDVAKIRAYSTRREFEVYDNVYASDAGVIDASYIRLKNASLSWQVPQSWTGKARRQYARVFAQAQNLLTITNYKGTDPEAQSLYSLPPLRVITVGVQFTL